MSPNTTPSAAKLKPAAPIAETGLRFLGGDRIATCNLNKSAEQLGLTVYGRSLILQSGPHAGCGHGGSADFRVYPRSLRATKHPAMKTIGIVVIAAFAAIAGGPFVAIKATGGAHDPERLLKQQGQGSHSGDRGFENGLALRGTSTIKKAPEHV